MKNKILLLLAIISTCLSINAQIKIDFSNGEGNKAYNCDGYTDWYLKSEINSGGSQSKTIDGDGVKITISHGSDTQADIIKRSWYETGLKSGTEEAKLLCDGIFACLKEDNKNYGDGSYGATSERVAINVTLSGLEVGNYSILAYHNYVMSDSHTLPKIGVEVNGTVMQTGIQQTQRKLTKVDAAYSFVNFEVTETGKDVVVTYFSDPEDGEFYTRTYFFINSLELSSSVVDPDDKVSNSYPANLDYHVDTKNALTLSWNAPKNGADSYTVYFDTDENAVTNGSASSQTTSLTQTGLSPLKRYYWRVDVVRDGVTYKGDVWSFQPRRLAFPGADGAGKYAIGGRGYNDNGIVYRVTSLEDNVDNPTQGTLRYGVEKLTGPRTIVFDVAGIITLTDRLNASDSYITVAGQTAPGIGILLRYNTYGANGPDNITRFMNFRYGHGDDWKEDSANQNVGGSAGMAGADNAIMDHCTMAWGNDEVFSSRNANDMTLQNCLIGEALNQNGHKNYWAENHDCQHGYAASIGGSVGSFHHNLLAHNAGRNWSMAGGLLGGAYAGKLSIYNNVVYNWYNRTTDGGAHNVNFVNNYYKKGVASDDSKFMLSAQLEGAGTGTQEYYVKGNVLELTNGNKIQDKEGTTYKWEDKGQDATWDVFVDQPYDFWSMEINVETAEAAFKNVLCDVGANFAGQDTNSKRLIQETKEGKWSKEGSRSGMKGLIDKEEDSEGWRKIEEEFGNHTRPANWDVDGDGIPAWFEGAMGWNDEAANNNADRDEDYWTDLEEYLNWMAVPHFYNMADDGTVSGVSAGTIDLSTYFAGYTSPSFSAAIVGSNGAKASVNGSTLTYDFASCTEKLVTINVTASESGISLTRSFNFFIDASDVEEPTVTPEGTAYTLSTETYKSSTNTTTWNFTPNDLTFTVTNNKKGYSTGEEYGVKYSAGEKYTIGIPTGIQVDHITFRGYDNYSGTDAYLGELNGTKYNATDYVFPQKDSEGKYTVAEHTIHFATPAKGTLTFTPAGNQVVWVITLYTSKVDVNLPDDVVNEMEKVADGTETVKETGTIKWVFNEGDNAKIAEYSAGIADYIKSTTVALGTQLDYLGKKNINGVTETLVQPKVKNKNPDETNTITFSVEAIDGATFTPTNVKFYISRIGTDEGYYDAKIGNEGGYSTITTKERPNRNNSDGNYYTIKDFDISSLSASQINSLIFNVYNLATGKQIGLANIIITGTLEYESTTTKTTVTLDEMATVHDLPAEDNVTVKMKRGLTAGAWNTFCVPFSVSKDKLQEALGGSEVEIVEYTEQEGTTLYFEDTDNIVAGKPYLIKPASFSSKYSDDMTPITFEGVDLEAANVKSNSREVASEVCPGIADYSFVGTYVRYIMKTDGTELGLNSKNKLAKPAASTNIMRGLRGFFRYNAGNGAGAKVVINGTLTSIDEIDGGTAGAKGVYHVSGRYVRSEWNNGSGLPRGLYIVNGQKMVK